MSGAKRRFRRRRNKHPASDGSWTLVTRVNGEDVCLQFIEDEVDRWGQATTATNAHDAMMVETVPERI